MRGTRYLSASRQFVSVCGSTPATPSNTTTAPSSTRSERLTSMLKSMCPGVSIRLICVSFQCTVIAALLMVMPRWRSWGSKSMRVLPSCTSPM
jgi:hypothetical protein